MPPRPDVFAREAEGIHRRFYSMVHALLMRHDLDGEGPGHSPGTEPLAPKLMLRLIGWSHQYQRRMARLGAGAERALLRRHATSTQRARPAFVAWREAAGRSAALRRGRVLQAHERRPLLRRVLLVWAAWTRERRELYGRG